MGYHERCPYTEKDPSCGKCMICHAVNPPAQAPSRRTCQRVRQWGGCPRYIEAWRIGVTPFREGYSVAMEEQRPSTGIGGVGMSVPTGIPMETALTPEPPCRFLVYKESSCKTCGGYVCSTSDDRRIMESMLEVCMSDLDECAIRIRVNEHD